MSDVLEQVDYTTVPGNDSKRRLSLYVLSTCIHCKRAMDYLGEKGLGYRYIYVDELEIPVKKELKSALKARHDNITLFPVLTIGDDRAISGFNAEVWDEALGAP